MLFFNPQEDPQTGGVEVAGGTSNDAFGREDLNERREVSADEVLDDLYNEQYD